VAKFSVESPINLASGIKAIAAKRKVRIISEWLICNTNAIGAKIIRKYKAMDFSLTLIIMLQPPFITHIKLGGYNIIPFEYGIEYYLI
jgi:hypothetical protein